MHYVIKQDIPGRLRVRCGTWVIDDQEGPALAHYLRNQDGIIDAQVRTANGSILVTYDKGRRDFVLGVLDELDVMNLPTGDVAEPDMGALTNTFYIDLLKIVASHYLRRCFLSAPLLNAWCVARALPHLYQGISALADHKVNVDVLDAMAIGVSVAQRNFTTASNVMFLLRVSDRLAEYTQSRTRCALRQSMVLYAESTWKVEGDTEIQVPIEDVCVGDLVKVRSGQLVPIDGVVVEGEASLNEASMTGESALVSKDVGDSVFAGTAVDEGELVIRTTALAGQSRIDDIVDMVENSEEAKAALQSRAEKLADSLVPMSLGIFFADLLLTRSLTRASSVLMVDYSCAVKLSTPIAVMSAMREATKLGIVAKGGKYLELLAKADTVVFDKTGTLTTAEPVCDNVVVFGDMDECDVLRLAACLEEHFPHSLARAIVRSADERGLDHVSEMHAEVEYLVAHGIASSIGDKRVCIGSAHFIFEDEGVCRPSDLEERIMAEAPGSSTVYLSVDGKLEAALCITDRPRPEAKAAIEGLRARGFTRIVMLTGDSENCACTVAHELGLDEYHSQVLPENKAGFVEALKSDGHVVLMVGDGINDSPALAAADISVAMSDASDIARTVADVTILQPSLDALLTARDLACGLISRIERSYQFIAGFNTSLILLGVVGVLAPSTAAALHNASTVALSAANMRPYLEGAGAVDAKSQLMLPAPEEVA